ncbi:MAG TPA: hypothetical protein VEV45_08855 [Streptosporangiaceae bacterium]|nr:hypothetical protein [Streptosporangiaceae bacterium]
MDDDKSWWFCLRHHDVEQGPGCPGKDRLGPYPTREAAERALETVRQRNEAWDAQDRWPGETNDDWSGS